MALQTVILGYLKKKVRRLGNRYRQKIVDVYQHPHRCRPAYQAGRGKIRIKANLKRNLKVAATWKMIAPQGPPLLGEVPEEA